MNDPQNNSPSFIERCKKGFNHILRTVKEKWISFKDKRASTKSNLNETTLSPNLTEEEEQTPVDTNKETIDTIGSPQQTESLADTTDLQEENSNEKKQFDENLSTESVASKEVEPSLEEKSSDSVTDKPKNKVIAILFATQVIILANWNSLKRHWSKLLPTPTDETAIPSSKVEDSPSVESESAMSLTDIAPKEPTEKEAGTEMKYELAIIPTQPEEVISENEDKKEKLIFTFNVAMGVIKNLALSLLVLLLVGGALAGGIGLGYFAYLVSTEKPPTYEEMRADISNLEQVSNMYFADNQPIGAVQSDLVRKVVPLSEMSKYLQSAIVATEDEYFYEHNGVVPKAVARALVQEFTGSKNQTGGSTLTQQLVKQQILSSEVSFKRKANEILLAIRLENYFTKDEILEAYLNTSTFGRNSSGQNIAGVEEAALGIFGIHASELNLPQAAFIAGLPQSPSQYTPYNQLGELRTNLEPGMERKNTVLFRMYREKFITKKDYDEAMKYDLAKDFIQPTESVDNHDYSFVYNSVLKEATLLLMKQNYKKDKLTDADIADSDTLYNKYYFEAQDQLQNNGYEIHSTIDKGVYDAMQNVVANYGDRFGTTYYRNKIDEFTGAVVLDETTGEPVQEAEPVQNGSVLMDNASGKIIGFVGGRDFSISQVDHAFGTHRQPGSTIKPLLVYAPALEQGLIQPTTMIPDTVINYLQPDGNLWNPSNYGGGISGKFVSAREALKRSYNNPTSKIYLEMLKNSPAGMSPKDYMKKLGFTSIADEEYERPALSLGGTETGPTVLEQTNAFAAVANNGNYVEGYMIENITDKKGNIIYEHETKSEPVFTPQTAYLTIDMMRSVVESGTAAGILNELNFSPDLAGKTGTTNDFIDVWFIASTPQVTLSSWIGYDNDGDERRQLQYYDNGADFDASGANESYWAELANAIYSVNPTIMGADKSFVRPNGIVSSTVLAQTGMKPGKMTLPDGKTLDVTGPTTTDLFNSNFLPGTTVFNFAVGATPSELNTFWFDTYLKAREEEEKKKIEDAKDKEQKKKEEENKKKSEEDKASEEKKKKEEEEKKKKEEEEKKKAEEEANKPPAEGTAPGTGTGTIPPPAN